ncbi:MAG: DUF3658 domain-containing protein [Burkholderiales bacterium]|jgi:hypothetical protein
MSDAQLPETSLLKTPLHLVSGDSAAGTLRAASAVFGLPGSVVGFSDDLTQGPLGDLAARDRYVRELLKNDPEFDPEKEQPFRALSTVLNRLDQCPIDSVVIWTGLNVNDEIFLAMLCRRLAGRSVPITRIVVPAVDDRSYVGMHTPQSLARLFETRQLVTSAEQVLRARDFDRLCARGGMLRRLEGSQVIDVPLSFYDPVLLTICSSDWQPAAQVVGQAMGRSDALNLMGDAFFTARLQALIDAGQIEARGPRERLRGLSVRRAGCR